MEDESLQEKLISLAKGNIIVLVLLVGGVIFLGIGIFQIFTSHSSNSKSEFKSTAEIAGAATQSSSLTEIKVDVEGEVVHPGVYSLPYNSRVQDAILAAGGFSTSANKELIQKTVNLAQKVVDGQKIYIPSSSQGTVSAPDDASSSTSVNGGLISINSGTVQDLDSLPGIGAVTAQKIIDNRPYSNLDDLVVKKAVGKATFEKIKDMITL